MIKTDQIPFLDLVTPHAELKEELVAVFRSALSSAGFIGGPVVEDFEREFARFCGVDHCIGVGSGTDALRFALMAAGIEQGSIVITVPNTFIATTEAISQAGAVPDFVDVDERTYNLDPARLEAYLRDECSVDDTSGKLIHKRMGRPVSAVVPVHLYGQMADMDAILRLADEYRLTVIEDACQAHGAEYFSEQAGCWKKAGSMGAAAAFSFYPGKNLGACGEAGAITTNDAEMARTMWMLRDHGQSRKYYHDLEGYNGRLDAIQAGILSAKLARLPEWTELRRKAAARYRELFAGMEQELVLPFEPAWSKAVYHLFVVRVEDRGELMRHLTVAGIGTGIHYPIPLHLQTAYKSLGYVEGSFPVAEKTALEIVSLPMFPQLRAEQQARVAAEVLKVQAVEKPWSTAAVC
jgi:dTDP-4-amino-4,6-dideoxygalactose transaminase